MNALSFDIEDYFHVENFSSVISRSQWDTFELRVESNTQKILELLENSGSRATFFILGWVAERCPLIVREIADRGHEIASHGYMHQLVYRLSKVQFRDDLTRAKKLLEDITGTAITGYRAPNFSITKESLWAIDILKECGFAYDSSIFPVSLHDRYGLPNVEKTVFKFANGLIEIPLTVFSFLGLNLPAGGGAYFRFFPYRYFKYVFTRLEQRGSYAVFYLHPWELDCGQPKIKVQFGYRLRHYFNINRVEKRLKRLLEDFMFTSIGNFIRHRRAEINAQL